MKNIVFFLIHLFPVFIISQIQDPNWKNLIPNYSFEVVSPNYPMNPGGGVGPTGLPDYYCYDDGGYEWIQLYWEEVYEWTHPLRRNVFCGIGQVPVGTANVLRDFNGSTNARSGLNEGDGTSSEFLVVPLWYGGIKQGKTYFVEVFRKSSAVSPSHLYLSQGQPRQCGYNDLKSPSNGLMLKILDIESSASGWHRTKGYFTLPFDLDWATFGHEDIGGRWDDLRIYEVQENGCRDNWYFDNTVFNYPFEFFQASDKIYVGNGVDPENGVNHIPGDVIVHSGTEVVLQAGNQVIIESMIMEPGSSRLVIENKPCNDNLCPEELTFEDEILCDIPSLQIGTSPNPWGTSVTWSPSTHLDNPNVANPTFTSPGGTGTVQYNVQVTYTCDAGFEFTSSYPVTVQYTDNDDPDATISVINTDWDVYNYSADFSLGDGVTELTITLYFAPGYQETFYVGTDFTGNTFNWELPDAWRWSSCHDDIIFVTARNGCSELEESITLNWLKTQIPFQAPPQLPNVITPDGDGVNDELWITVPSADNYSLLVQNRWGNQIIETFIDIDEEVKDEKLVIFSPSQYQYSDGVYFYKIDYTDLCGNSYEGDMFFHLFNSLNAMVQDDNISGESQIDEFMTNIDNKSIDEGLHTLESNSPKNSSILIYPNPTERLINITSQDSKISNVSIYDFKGNLVYFINSNDNNVSVEVSNLAAGIYWVEVHSEHGVNRHKVSVL